MEDETIEDALDSLRDRLIDAEPLLRALNNAGVESTQLNPSIEKHVAEEGELDIMGDSCGNVW